MINQNISLASERFLYFLVLFPMKKNQKIQAQNVF